MRKVTLLKKISILLGLISIIGCSSTFQRITNISGYAVIPNEDIYHIEYYAKEKLFTEDSWKKAAQKTCPNGYELLSKKDKTNHSTFKSPVGGILVNLGSHDFQVVGKIKCNIKEKTTILLVKTAWKLGSDLYSHSYVGKEFGLRRDTIRRMNYVSLEQQIDNFDYLFGETFYQEEINNLTTQVRIHKKNHFPTVVIMKFDEECVTKIALLPPHISLLYYKKNPKDYISQVSTYNFSYTLTPECKISRN
jgi:hypothetical protein